MTVAASNLDPEQPRLDITCAMTRPTTSSIIAALVNITPKRVVVSPLVRSKVNVVPKLVEHNAAPAAKHWSRDALAKHLRRKDSPMGIQILVVTTIVERMKFALSDPNEVDNPPA